MNKFQFEVCANSVESCLAAQKGGANRVELCAGIPEGGTTPSYGEISVAREVLDATRLHVIIRPRGGDFLYSPIEVKAMLKDIEMAKQLKADASTSCRIVPHATRRGRIWLFNCRRRN